MTDKELAQALTGALDERIARAESAPVARELLNRVPMPYTADAPVIRAVPVRQARWKAAVAAVLALVVLGGIGLLPRLLDRNTPDPLPTALTPANCHLETFSDGETAWVQDGTYQGEYKLQHFTVSVVDDPDYPAWVGKVEDGFLKQEIMRYEDYAAYCTRFGVEQSYSDPNFRYLVVSNASGHAFKAEAAPVDLITQGSTAYLWLWDFVGGGMANDSAGYVLTIPVPAETEALELNKVFTPEEAEQQRLFHRTKITEESDGTYRIEGWCVGAFPEMLYLGKERIGLELDENTEIDEESMRTLSGASADCFGLEIRAEGCVPYEGAGEKYQYADRWYRVQKLTVLQTGKTLETVPTEPDDPSLPQVVYDADSRTIRITGTENYDHLDLSPYLDDVLNLEVEDDKFRLTAYLGVLGDLIDDPAFLPGYLNRLDRSIDFIGNYIADVAPSEEIAAQTRKPIIIWQQSSGYTTWRNNAEDITLTLGKAFKRHGLLYTFALINPKYDNWYQLGYAYWVSFGLDPYNSLYVGYSYEDSDYFYFKDYFRLGGTEDTTPENFILMSDANAWYNLVNGKDWGGNETERGHINEETGFNGDPNLEGNDMCLAEAESLLNYLAEQYGHDKVAAFCFETCTFEEAFGTDFASARAAWEQSLLDRFGDGSENPAELPQVSFDKDTKTLRIVGTGNYDRVDLSRLPEAETLIVEDDDFSYTILPALLYGDDSYIKDDVAGYLPGYLDRVDKSLATIRQFVADNAPNEDVIAQSQKPVKLELKSFKSDSYENSENQIELDLGSAYRWHGPFYTMALMDPESAEWQHIGYAFWVGLCVDPYCSIYTKTGSVVPPDPDYAYNADYYRLGGTEDWRDLNNQRLLADANSWYNLVYGTTWGGNEAERGCVSNVQWFNSKNRTKEGNKRPLTEAISLLNYLAEQYGADKVTAYCFDTCSFEEAFGMDYATARAAWEQSLMERFGNGSENP